MTWRLLILLRGSTLENLDNFGKGSVSIEKGLTACRATGAELARPYLLSLLAEALIREGLYEEALRTVHEALAVGQKTGERWYEAELYRLKGELLLCMSSY